MVCHDEIPSLIGDAKNGHGHWGRRRSGMKEESSSGRWGMNGSAHPNYLSRKSKRKKRGTWVAQSVKCLTRDYSSGHDLRGRETEPRIGLHTQQGVCLRFSPSAPPKLQCTCSKINK